MNLRNSTEIDAEAILRQLKSLQPNQIARFIVKNPEYVNTVNAWVQGRDNIQLVSGYERENAFRDGIRDAFIAELEKNDELREEFLQYQVRSMALPAEQLPSVMDTSTSIDMFLGPRENIKQQLIDDYEVRLPPNLVTYDEYACYALLTDDVKQVQADLLSKAIHYFSDSLSERVLGGMQKTLDFLQDPKDFVDNLRAETMYQEKQKDDVDNRYTNLSGVKLTELADGGDLSWCYLNGFNLANTDMRLANLNEVFLTDANLTGANLGGASIDNMKFEKAFYDKHHIAEVIRDNEAKKQALESQKHGKRGSLPGASSQGIFGDKKEQAKSRQRKQSLDAQDSKKEGKKKNFKEHFASVKARFGRKG